MKTSLLAASLLVSANLSWGQEIPAPPQAPEGGQTGSAPIGEPRPCDEQWMDVINRHRGEALDRLDSAIRNVQRGIDEHGQGGTDRYSPRYRALYQYWLVTGVCSTDAPPDVFHQCINSYMANQPDYILNDIKDGLTSLKNYLGGMQFMCSPPTGDIYCSMNRDPNLPMGQAEAYAALELGDIRSVLGLGSAAPSREIGKVYLCPAFRTDRDTDYVIQSLIHETAHLASNSLHPAHERYCSEGGQTPYDCNHTCRGNTMRSGGIAGSSIQADTWAHLAKCLARPVPERPSR
jgi:hypothetical protein